MEKNEKFEYTYTALTENEHKTIESIRNEYLPIDKNKEKIERLKSLDNKVKKFPKNLLIFFANIGVLVFGLGMSMILEWNIIIGGILVCLLGVGGIILAYPIYKWILCKNKRKYSQEILRLSEELLHEEKK